MRPMVANGLVPLVPRVRVLAGWIESESDGATVAPKH